MKKLSEALPVLSELEKVMEKAQWEKTAFVRALSLGNALISQADADSYTRYLLHQEFNRYFSELRSEKLGEESEVVFGFFRRGEAEEISLFSGYPETVDDLFRQQPGYGKAEDLIIGYGCKDCSVTVQAAFDTSADHDWGWEDGMGQHVEQYDAETRTFYRRSMSGRTHYCLKIGEGNVAVPMERAVEVGLS